MQNGQVQDEIEENKYGLTKECNISHLSNESKQEDKTNKLCIMSNYKDNEVNRIKEKNFLSRIKCFMWKDK